MFIKLINTTNEEQFLDETGIMFTENEIVEIQDDELFFLLELKSCMSFYGLLTNEIIILNIDDINQTSEDAVNFFKNL